MKRIDQWPWISVVQSDCGDDLCPLIAFCRPCLLKIQVILVAVRVVVAAGKIVGLVEESLVDPLIVCHWESLCWTRQGAGDTVRLE